jgi:c-di-GMP-binding flagellar brake protein YcgR
MPRSSDRRQQRRVRLPQTHGSLVVSLDGTVLDISLSGMAVETNTRLAPLRTIRLRLGNGDRSLTVSGRVVWCFLHGTRSTEGGEQLPVYRAGIQFLDVLSPQAQELVRFLEAHAIVTLETRLFGRFRIADNDAVEVSSSSVFRVVELDTSGLTVETAIGLEPRTGCEVELQLDGSTITARTEVLEAQQLESREEAGTWRIKLRFDSLSAADRERLGGFLRSALGASPS